MQIYRTLWTIAAIAPSLPITAALTQEDRWEKNIAAFEEADAKSASEKGATLFIGSSSIVMWDTAASFPGYTTINRGFGGSQIVDSLRYADRIVIPYEPKLAIFY
ncbi:MAG: hypothetical protein QGG73_10740, partial [Candidatus Hydrogenedentes bacterium]|nr:hypothetical protein [Candidatus Hydrogenedentota bacterium]